MRVDLWEDPYKGIQYVNAEQMAFHGMDYDTMSAAMVPWGYTLEVFNNNNFMDHLETIEGKSWDSNDMMVCQKFSKGNDKVNSLIYRRNKE